MQRSHHLSRQLTIAFALAAGGAATAYATPEASVQAVLAGPQWAGENGRTWERTTNNTLVQAEFTPITPWGTNPLLLSYPVYDHSGSAGNAYDLNPTPGGDGSDLRACAAPTVGKDPTCGAFGAGLASGELLARCQAYGIFRRQNADPVVNRCGGQSDQMLNDVWDLVSSARSRIDVTTLFDPTGRFKTALRNGIQFAANELVRTGSTNVITVRVLLGEQHATPAVASALSPLRALLPAEAAQLLQQASHPKELAEYLGGGLSPAAAARVQINVGVYHPSPSVWNHAKIIAVDGRRALVGGHNLWDPFPYFDLTPVHDLSVLVEGGAAASAHKFVDQLWATVCSSPEPTNRPGGQMVWRWNQTANAATSPLASTAVDFFTHAPSGWTCPAELTAPPAIPPGAPFAGAVTMYAVGRTGNWNYNGATGTGRNPADAALAAMIRGAGHEVDISQQNVSGPKQFSEALHALLGTRVARWLTPLADYLTMQGAWTDDVLTAMAEAAANDRKVRIIVADRKAANEYNGGEPREIIAAILRHWPGRPGTAVKTEAQLLCNIEVAALRSSDHDPPYPANWMSVEALPPGNHAKMVMVDPSTADAGFYVGSQNLYGHELAEFGYMVFGQAPTNTLVTTYWNDAWRYSSGAANANARVVRPSGCVVVDNEPASAVFGQPDFTSAAANNGGVAGTRVSSPNGVAFDPASARTFVADSDNARVLQLSSTWTYQAVWGQPDATTNAAPIAITNANTGRAPDGNRVAFVGTTFVYSDTTRNRVVVLNPLTSATFLLGQTADNTGAAATTATGLRGPTGVWTDGTRIAVADTGNHRVLIWNALPTAHGRAADIVLGQTGPTAALASAPPSLATMNAPRGVFSDGTRLYVADSGNNRVLVWNAFPTAAGPADFVVGQNAANAAGAATTASGMSSPCDIEVTANAMFVSDSGNHRVLVYSPIPTANGAAASSVLGQANLTSAATPGPTRSSLREPQALAIAQSGRYLMVADRAQHRILAFLVNAP